ncbi:MAG: hypothetical protein AABY07_01300 [Nanoarchaeota archaeon]
MRNWIPFFDYRNEVINLLKQRIEEEGLNIHVSRLKGFKLPDIQQNYNFCFSVEKGVDFILARHRNIVELEEYEKEHGPLS